MENGLTIDIAEQIDIEIKAQIAGGFNVDDDVFTSAKLISLITEVMCEYNLVSYNPVAIKINAIRIAACASRIAQSI